MNSSGRSYTAEDLLRYHRGEMRVAEMHQLERAALEDPFLSDALEGYAYADEKTNPATIKLPTSVSSPQHPGAAIRPMKKWFAPLSVAASLLLLLTIGYFAFKKDTATIDTNPVATASPDLISPATDSTSVVANQPGTDNMGSFSAKHAEELAAVLKSDQQKTKGTIVSDNIITGVKKQDKKIEAVRVQSTSSIAGTDDVLVSAKPMAIASEKLSDVETKDHDGSLAKDEVKLQDSLPVYAMVHDTRKMPLPAAANVATGNAFNNNVSDRNDVSMNEVVVTGYNKKREKKLAVDYTPVSVAQIQASNAKEKFKNNQEINAVPENGIDNFRVYIKNNHQACQNNGKVFAGKFTVSFNFDKQGVPYRIKSKGLSKECDKELKRLLLSGPHWTGGSQQKVELELEF